MLSEPPPPSEPRSDVHPDEAVALGAAIQAAIVDGEPIEAVLVDVRRTRSASRR